MERREQLRLRKQGREELCSALLYNGDHESFVILIDVSLSVWEIEEEI